MDTIHIEEVTDVTFEVMKKKRVIAIENEKGGVGKSTTTVNLAAALGGAGYSVLVIDLSSQANTTKTLLAHRTVHHHQEVKNSIYDLLRGKKNLTVGKAIRTSREPNVSIIAGHHQMSKAEIEILPMMDSHRALLRIVGDEDVSGFDYIIIDTPPEIKFSKQLAAMASDLIIIPVLPSSYSLDGIESLIIDLAEVSQMRGEKLDIRILLCQTLDGVSKGMETRYAQKYLAEHYPNNLLGVDIPFSRKVQSAQRHNQSVIRYAGADEASTAYAHLAIEVKELLDHD